MNPIYSKRKRRPAKTKATLHSEAKRTIKSLIITLSLMIATLGVAFLLTTNESSQKGYALQQEKLKNEHLKSVNTNLTTKVTQATSFSELENDENINEMEEIEEKNYVTSEDNSVY